MERTFGIIHKPRIGRSDESSLGNLNRFHDSPANADMEFYIARDMEPEVLLDLDYEGAMSFIKITRQNIKKNIKFL